MDTLNPRLNAGRRAIHALAFLSAVFFTALPLICHAQAPTATVTILHSFGDGSVANDGVTPTTALVQGTNGNFDGTTWSGGASAVAGEPGSGCGVVFQITPSGKLTILHSFGDDSITNDGQYPNGSLIEDTVGNLYGTTRSGGSADGGTGFKMTPLGSETILHSFNDGSVPNDGVCPGGGLVFGTDDNIYGTTSYGGSTVSVDPNHQGYGTAFSMTPAGQEIVLHSFDDGAVANDGVEPIGIMQASDGNFYGTTWAGGSAGDGTVFKMTPTGQVAILHSFSDGTVSNDGNTPGAGLIEGAGGIFYGTTEQGYAGAPGTIFSITSTGQETILHSFDDNGVTDDGAVPIGGLVEGPDGNFYGTTGFGGTADDGIVYMVTPAGEISILHSFHDGSVANDGIFPVARLTQGTDGNLYGTAEEGGSAGEGVVFKVTLKAATTINFTAGLHMVSLPFTYYGVNLNSLLGYSGVNLAAWSPAGGQYVVTPAAPADQFHVGQGYWARFPQAVSITLPGAPADTTQNFDIPLTEGWNMIGDPFLASISITNLLFNNGTETFAQAASGHNPLISGTVWSYSTSSNRYVRATSISPEQSYWIQAFANTGVQVPHP